MRLGPSGGAGVLAGTLHDGHGSAGARKGGTLLASGQAPRELISREELDRRVDELAAEIERDYADSEDLLCVGVLKGSVFFMADLLKRLSRPLVLDFFQTSSYRGETTAPGEVRIRRDLDHALAGRDVLLIEDIVDTGYTMRTIMALMGFRGARSVRLCVLLDKACKRETPIEIHYRGFEVDDVFLVGYGLDYDDRYRNLPYIGVLGESEAAPGD